MHRIDLDDVSREPPMGPPQTATNLDFYKSQICAAAISLREMRRVEREVVALDQVC
jgi:hypothetical protein